MRTIPTILCTLLCIAATAQFPHMDAAKLLAKHYGGQPTGSPPRITWVPQGEEAERIGYMPDKHVVTLVDTMLGKGEDDILVFFRTTKPMDGVIEAGCEACSDQLGVAHYAHRGTGENGWEPVSFTKWFIEQGTYDGPPKPRMLPDTEGSPVFMIVSNDGDMVQSTRTEHYFSLPDMKPVLQVKTAEYVETRGGPNGPEMSLTERTVKVVTDPANWKEYPDIAVTGGEGTDGGTVRYSWNDQQKKYVDAKTVQRTVPKTGAVRPATKVPAKPNINKP